MTTAHFKQIDDALANQLLAFVRTNNIGKSIAIDGKEYTLDHISQSSSQFFQSRSISIYFRTSRSIIRISDHWTKSNHHQKSRKFNCGSLGGHFCQWVIDDKTPTALDCTYRCGKFAHKMLAGICGLAVLNKTAPHWNKSEVKSA
jgi:hypothetical protein